MWNIPATVTALREGLESLDRLQDPMGLRQGPNTAAGSDRLEAGQRLQRLAGRAHPLDRVLVRGQRRLREPAAVQARVRGHLAQPGLALVRRAEQLEPVEQVLLDVRMVVEQVAVGVPCADPVVGEVVAGQPLPQDRLPGLGHALVLEGRAEREAGGAHRAASLADPGGVGGGLVRRDVRGDEAPDAQGSGDAGRRAGRPRAGGQRPQGRHVQPGPQDQVGGHPARRLDPARSRRRDVDFHVVGRPAPDVGHVLLELGPGARGQADRVAGPVAGRHAGEEPAGVELAERPRGRAEHRPVAGDGVGHRRPDVHALGRREAGGRRDVGVLVALGHGVADAHPPEAGRLGRLGELDRRPRTVGEVDDSESHVRLLRAAGRA